MTGHRIAFPWSSSSAGRQSDDPAHPMYRPRLRALEGSLSATQSALPAGWPAERVRRAAGSEAKPVRLRINVRKRPVIAAGQRYAGACSTPMPAYRAVRARDRRFDGRFFVAITSTRYLLPADLHGSAREAHEHALLFPCRCCRGRGFQALFALPAGARSGHGAGRCGEPIGERRHGRHRGACAVERARRRSGRLVRHQRPALAPRHRSGTRCFTHCLGSDTAFAAGQAAAARDLADADRYCLRQRFRQRAPLQCLVQIALRIESARGARQRHRCGHLERSIGVQAAAGLESLAGLFASARHSRRGMADATHYRRTVSIGEAKGWISVSMHDERRAEPRAVPVA